MKQENGVAAQDSIKASFDVFVKLNKISKENSQLRMDHQQMSSQLEKVQGDYEDQVRQVVTLKEQLQNCTKN